MGPNTWCPRTWSVCAVGRFPPSVPWHSVNSLLASKHWSDSSGKNRFAAYTNAFSVSSPLKASLSILVCSLSIGKSTPSFLANERKRPYHFVVKPPTKRWSCDGDAQPCLRGEEKRQSGWGAGHP